MNRAGFTLVEVTMAAALIFILASLGFIAVQTSATAVNVNNGRAILQSEARSIMLELAREVELAIQPVGPGETLPPGAQGLRVQDGGRAIQFLVPVDGTFTLFSAPITFTLENEDTPETQAGSTTGNARLDSGEDLNNDDILTRRIVRTQSGITRVIGGSNNVANAVFELLDNNDVLRVTLLLTLPISNRQDQLLRYEVQQDIYLMN
jgi:Tfp pilus assembly protein PilE